MADHVVLVNGLPGAGKSTLAARLAPLLNVPLIGKDLIKEGLAAAAPGVPARGVGPVAAQVMWELAAVVPGTVLLESWWFRPRDRGFAQAGLARSGAASVVEVWCEVPAELARERVHRRRRPPELYHDEQRVRESWEQWAAQAGPLDVGEVVPVRTDREVDLADLIRRVGEATARATGRPGTRHAGTATRPPSPLPDAARGGPG
jgi:predicted kinase